MRVDLAFLLLAGNLLSTRGVDFAVRALCCHDCSYMWRECRLTVIMEIIFSEDRESPLGRKWQSLADFWGTEPPLAFTTTVDTFEA
jgi:hypothetical protein